MGQSRSKRIIFLHDLKSRFVALAGFPQHKYKKTLKQTRVLRKRERHAGGKNLNYFF